MNIVVALLLIAVLIIIPLIGVGVLDLTFVFGVVIPYAAIAIFLVGIIYRIVNWARSPVPFRIPTSSGQQKSLPWVRNSSLDNPHTGWGVIGRMALEILFFRSLFRNTKAELREGPKLVYGDDKWLWAAGLAFHWTFLIIFLRHFKFFAEPVPGFVELLQNLDGFFQVGLPIIYLTDLIIIAAVTFLFFRRIVNPQVRYISLMPDYFAVLLILSIAVSGIAVRYFFKTDLLSIKELGTGLIALSPTVPDGINAAFFVHLFLVSTLLAYFPFSKLMHLGGVFLSPTRNLANNSRMKRHINPWNPKVKVHTYEEYEDEFREVMKAADMPLEKEEA
jgi:nitrate reductase gamma subunit